MVIEINKDIERYKESVLFGFTAKQLLFSVASIAAGAGIVMLLYPYIGLTFSVYVAVPVVAPIAMGGFYSLNGMSFYEVTKRKNRYSKCYRFQDINYATTSEAEQMGIFEQYCKFLNSLDVNFKITINNKNKDMERVKDQVFLQEREEGFQDICAVYNEIVEKKINEGRQGIEQERYLTLTIERKSFEEAKAQFATLEASVTKEFRELGAEITALTGNERIKVLYDFYHLGEEESFDFDIAEAKKVGGDFRNDLCNKVLQFYPDYFKDEKKYCRALFIKKYPSSLSDRFLNER